MTAPEEDWIPPQQDQPTSLINDLDKKMPIIMATVVVVAIILVCCSGVVWVLVKIWKDILS